MKITKEDISNILSKVNFPSSSSGIVDSGSLKNVQIFGDEIILDIEISNPTLQYKKKIEALCIEAIHDMLSDMKNVKINFAIKEVKKDIKIQGNPIPNVKNIIAVSSGKGGVGKSTIAANLSTALAELGYSVGIVDADIYGPSMPIMFDLVGEIPQAIELEGKKKMKPPSNYNVKMVSMGFFTEANQAVVWRGPMASKALNQLIWDTHWGALDYLIIDLPPGTGDIHLSLVQAIPLTGAIVVTTPQEIALADAKKGVNMFQMDSIDVPVIGIVENMSYFTPEELPENKYYIFGKDGGKDLAEQLNLNLLGQIPIVQSLREASDGGRPAVLQENTQISKSFINLAKNVVDSVSQRNVDLPCLLYTSPSPRDVEESRMPSSA